MAAVIMEHPEQLRVKWLVLIVLFTACFHESKKKETRWYNETEIQLQNAGGVYQLHDQPFTGIVYALANDQEDTIAVASFFNGKENGEWRKYYPGGKLMERRFYSEGQKTGVYEGWWPNGKQRLLYHFNAGEYEGNCRDWNGEGTLISSMHYENGYESGLQQQFYENGKVKANYMMIEGRRYGLLGTKNCVNVSDSIFKK